MGVTFLGEMRYIRRGVALTTSGILIWLLAQISSRYRPCDDSAKFEGRSAVINDTTFDGPQEQVGMQSNNTYSQGLANISIAPPRLLSLKELTWSRFVTKNGGQLVHPGNQSQVYPTWFRSTICDRQDASCWDYCIPFRGDVDEHSCSSATKYDIMVPSSGDRKHCHASVLHMMLDDFINATYTDPETARIRPLLTYGTLLGAFRTESIIPWTHDVDLAFFSKYWTPRVQTKLATELRKKGYSLFHQDIWRLCLNVQHPLSNLLLSEMGNFQHAKRVYGGDIPYLDLYHLKEEAHFFRHATVANPLGRTTLLPVRRLRLLGKDYETINAPETFFKEVGYGNYTLERVEPHK